MKSLTLKNVNLVLSSTIDIRKVKVNADLTIKTLKSCRNEANYDFIWDCVNLRCAW